MRYLVESILFDDKEKNLTIYDSQSIDWLSFNWSNGYYPHKISSIEIQKPYLISYAYYGTVEYEDVILLLNGIEDPFELIPGKELMIPKVDDLKTFILKNRK